MTSLCDVVHSGGRQLTGACEDDRMSTRSAAPIGISALFTGAGVMHFARPDFFEEFAAICQDQQFVPGSGLEEDGDV